MTPSDAELLAALPGAAELRRRPYEFVTSCPLTELNVTYAHGVVRMLLKELVPQVRRPGFAGDPRREIAVYRDVLAPAGVGPKLHAHGADWIVIEIVDGVELWQVGEVQRWGHVASWLGTQHRRFARRVPELRAAGLRPLDADVLASWVDRAEQSIRGLVDPAAGRAALAALTASPPTLVHGEFYPSNVLVAGERVVPVDWETAVLGPRALDLAALVTGWDDAVQKQLIAAYGHIDAADLDRARLALALRWIGWQPGWTPPTEHRHDWVAEALGAAERLGL